MKTIFITGGSTGIGAASVRKFIAEGWNVGFMDINTQAAHALVDELNSPERLLFIEGNTRTRSDIRRAVEATVARFGSLNSVFANAGIHRCNTILDIADEELDLMIQTNIYGTVNTLREAIPPIITQKEMTFVPPRVTRIITGVVNIMAAFIIPSSSAAPDWSFGSTIRTSERPLGVVPVAVP